MKEADNASIETGIAPVLPFVVKNDKGELEQFMVQPLSIFQEPRSTVWAVEGYDTETLRDVYSVFDANGGTGLIIHGDPLSHQIEAFAETMV